MGCSHKTVKQSIPTNKLCTVTNYSNVTTTSFNNKLENQFQPNNSKLNQHLQKNHYFNDCQFIPKYQQKTIAAKASKSLTPSVFNNYNFNVKSQNNNDDKFKTKEISKIKRTNWPKNTFQQEIINFGKEKEVSVLDLKTSCKSCYSVKCQKKFCCVRHHKQQPDFIADEIANHKKGCLNSLDYITTNNSQSLINCCTNCSNNNNCLFHLSIFYPKHTKNTLRNGHQCEPHLCHCNYVSSQANHNSMFANAHSAKEYSLQKSFSQARTSLTANALDLKNSLMEVMANCAIVAESLKGINTLCDIVSKNKSSNVINTNNKNNNHNKSEPYRGYCQRKHHLPNEISPTSYTISTISPSSTSFTSISNSYSLHDAISSNSQCYNNNHDINNTSNRRSCSGNGNKNFKRYSNNHNHHNCQASSAHSAAFNYISQNYYSFLRNTINFYTASSFILVLCYLASTTSAATTKSDSTSIDKHPIQGIDWSKFDESSSDKEILDLLLEKKRYDKRLLPPVNGTLTVNVNVLLLSLASPDESSLKYEVEFLLNQQWNDPRLQYGNKSHYDFLNALHHHDGIWTPDTYFIMHGDFKDPIIPMHFALRIYRNGTITYAMRRHLILSCQGSLHIFPFDDPKCSFSMESISYEEAQIKYIWKNDEDTLRKSPSLTTLNAYLIKNQTTACEQNSWRGNYSCLHVELTFTRDRAYYFTTVFIPGIILVTSSFITFWLEWNAVPARVMIGVTTMLNFFTTSNGFRSTLPVVSNLTAMNVWDGVCMCFIYASLLEFVCVNYMGRKRPQHNVVYRPGENPVTQRLPAVLSRIGVILASPLAGTGLSSTGTSMGMTPTAATPMSEPLTKVHFYEEPSGGIIAAAVQNLRSRSLKRRSIVVKQDEGITKEIPSHVYDHVYTEPSGVTTFAAVPSITTTTVTIESDTTDDVVEPLKLRRTQSMSTNTPPLICKSEIQTDINCDIKPESERKQTHVDKTPIKPPRKKSSRSTSPSTQYESLQREMPEMMEISAAGNSGEKKREAGGPNEIVACTTCGGSSGSPCTHSANNGCATETCFVQVRKKEPPHPIRIAKTIDVIARITFPTAYAIFLIFFFVHYKAFS